MERKVYEGKQVLTSTFEKNWYWGFESLFWPEQVMRIREICDAKEEEVAVTDGYNASNADTLVRKNKISWHDNEELYSMIMPIIHGVNRDSEWNYNITAIEPIQYTIYYGDNNHFAWHIDTLPRDPQLDRTEGVLAGTVRKISCSIQLSDSDDYEGGDFELLSGVNREYLEGGKENFNLESIELSHLRGKGAAIVFPSFTYHRVKPVTKGIRRSLVCWFRGPKWT